MELDNKHKMVECPMCECKHNQRQYCQLEYIKLEKVNTLNFKCISIEVKGS
ncbi:MAG: hypothetical protein ACRDD7_10455 [Peptostreptococcaceae bacterium]